MAYLRVKTGMPRIMVLRLAFLTIILTSLSLQGCGTLGWFNARAPGMKMTEAPERTWERYGCANRKLPFLEVNAVEVSPSTIAPGASFNQRIVYSACLPIGRSELPVRLQIRVFRGEQEVLADMQPQFIIKPGRWAVDATVTTPPSAPDGPYRLKVNMYGVVSGDGAMSFTVRK